MRILVCGDRNWTNYGRVLEILKEYPKGTVIINGYARGADRAAHNAAIELGFEVEDYKAKWTLYGKAAGPIRNQEMLVVGQPDLVIAFHSNLENSKGTKDMLNRAKKAGLSWRLIVS